MGRSLKEALLDQFALLQERGLAPSEMPQEEEAPLIVVESAPRGRAMRSRRDSGDRFNDRGDEMGMESDFDRDRRRGIRREHRGEEGGADRRRGARGRGRPTRVGAPREEELATLSPLPTLGGRPRTGPDRRPPMGPRPDRPGFGAPRPGGPPRPGVGRTEMMQQRAEQRRQEEDDIAEMRRLLGELSGQEMDEAAMDTFSRALTEETGALPPPRIVVDAIKQTGSADAQKIGDAVRAYYRSRRARPQGNAPRPGGPPRPEQANSDTPSETPAEPALASAS